MISAKDKIKKDRPVLPTPNGQRNCPTSSQAS
nr:MAG TPA: hypothetical protein [Caudoviricetes sp.]